MKSLSAVRPVKFTSGTLQTEISKSHAKIQVLHKAFDSLRQSVDIIGRNPKSVYPINNGFRCSSGSAGDNRLAARVRLEKHHSEALDVACYF